GAHIGDLGERRRAVPAVDRQGQRTAHPGVVERLLLVVRLHHAAAVPVAFLHRDLVAEGFDDLIAGRGRQPAKLHRRTVAADRLDPHRLLVGKYAGKAVEIRQAFSIVVGVSYPLDRLPGLVFGELEWAGAENVLFVPARILVEGYL